MTASNALARYLAIAPQSPEEGVLRLLVELGVQVSGADEGSLLVLDAAARELEFAMTVGESEAKLRGQRVPVGEGLTGLAAATGEVQTGAPTYEDVEQDDQRSPPEGPQAVIAAPMLVADEAVGVITAISFAPDHRFQSSDVDLFGRLAAIAGVVVQQRQGLNRIAETPPETTSPREAAEDRIAAAVGRLASLSDESLERVAGLLESMVALTEADES